MSKVLVRHHILNGGEIWLQRRRLIPSLFCMKVGYNWYKLDTPNYLIVERLNQIAKEAEKLLAALAIADRDLKLEKKDVDKCIGQARNTGDWFLLDLKDLGKNPINGASLIPDWGPPPDLPKPESFWKKVFQSRLFARASQKGAADRQRHIEGHEGGRTTFLSEEMSQFKDVVEESTGADTIIPYRHKDTGKDGKGKKKNHGKNRIKGESDEEYESRMEDLRHGKHNDRDDDEPLNW